jgi:hypothetical protein
MSAIFARLAFVALFASACGPDAAGPAPSDDNNNDDQVVEDVPTWDGATVAMSGRIIDSLYKMPIADLEICVTEPYDSPCTTTDADGFYELAGVPDVAELIFEFSGEDYFPTFVMYTTTGDDFVFDGGVYGNGTVTYLATLIEQELSADKGHLGFSVVDEEGLPLEGVTVTTVQPVGTGVFFTDSSGKPNGELAVTDSPGRGVIVNVEPGLVDVKFSHPELDCKLGFGWVGTDRDTITMRAIAGGMTYARAICE